MKNRNLANLFKFIEEKQPKYMTPWQVLAHMENFTDIGDADTEKWIFSFEPITDSQKKMVLDKLPMMTDDERKTMSKYIDSKGKVKDVFLGQEYIELLPKYEIGEFAEKISKKNKTMLGWDFLDKITKIMKSVRNKGRRLGTEDYLEDDLNVAKFLHDCGFEGYAMSTKELPKTGSLISRMPRGMLFTPNGMKMVVFSRNPKGK